MLTLLCALTLTSRYLRAQWRMVCSHCKEKIESESDTWPWKVRDGGVRAQVDDVARDRPRATSLDLNHCQLGVSFVRPTTQASCISSARIAASIPFDPHRASVKGWQLTDTTEGNSPHCYVAFLLPSHILLRLDASKCSVMDQSTHLSSHWTPCPIALCLLRRSFRILSGYAHYHYRSQFRL